MLLAGRGRLFDEYAVHRRVEDLRKAGIERGNEGRHMPMTGREQHAPSRSSWHAAIVPDKRVSVGCTAQPRSHGHRSRQSAIDGLLVHRRCTTSMAGFSGSTYVVLIFERRGTSRGSGLRTCWSGVVQRLFFRGLSSVRPLLHLTSSSLERSGWGRWKRGALCGCRHSRRATRHAY